MVRQFTNIVAFVVAVDALSECRDFVNVPRENCTRSRRSLRKPQSDKSKAPPLSMSCRGLGYVSLWQAPCTLLGCGSDRISPHRQPRIPRGPVAEQSDEPGGLDRAAP